MGELQLKSSLCRGWRNLSPQLRQTINPSSLQFRLTASITGLIVLGLTSVALWTSWKMQRTLIASHKQKIVDIADRIADDVVLYQQDEMFTLQKSIEKAINNRSGRNLLLWVNDSQGSLVATSTNMSSPAWQRFESPSTLATAFRDSLAPKVYHIQNRDFVACHSPLIVGNRPLGTLFVAQDITEDQRKFVASVQSLALASSVAIVLITLVLAWYVHRSLRPLCQMGLMTKAISPDDLGEKKVDIQNAPSEIQELADTFNMMLDRLSAAWREQQHVTERQREFVSNVSHELRTPLAIVRGYLQSIQRRGDNLTEMQREALQISTAEADLTIRLLQDLLCLARADDGYMPYHLETLILNDIAAEVVSMADRFNHRQIILEAESPLISIFADADRLQQVLVNLVENAIKYSEATEPVTVKLEQREESALIHVCDRGDGIPLKQQSRIFERFYRLDEARARSTGGAGLGLSLVKTFTEGMGGHVNVLSQEGEGSTFTVTLPISPEAKI
ncbi:HAMP domain-containing sensor histidine kinase [Acaryochloris sp. IP29b_bin.148]|uniref:sensor histidine kinase n=1 Tax=Acaryochloris sp. IP29b_bin.148 TaxID=2969218 RepID=UPI00262BCFED|nr:HAMP domain-containing sensor histidine kinase [Acaryochloris sp. IP29b_bin.148]